MHNYPLLGPVNHLNTNSDVWFSQSSGQAGSRELSGSVPFMAKAEPIINELKQSAV